MSRYAGLCGRTASVVRIGTGIERAIEGRSTGNREGDGEGVRTQARMAGLPVSKPATYESGDKSIYEHGFIGYAYSSSMGGTHLRLH